MREGRRPIPCARCPSCCMRVALHPSCCMRVALLLLVCLSARAAGAGDSAVASAPPPAGAAAASPAWSALDDTELLSGALAGLVQAPCGAYAHAFRPERESVQELLAAQRLALYASCAAGDGRHCDALRALRAQKGGASDWATRVAALQAVLHELCQTAAIELSRREGNARGAAATFVTSAVKSVAELQMKLADARGDREVLEGTPQFLPQLASAPFGAVRAAQPPAPAPAPPPPASPEDALFPALLPWPGLAAAGWGALPATREGRTEVGVVERRALTELFRAAGGARWAPWARARWAGADTASHCAWAGVTCGEAGAGVVALRLRSAGLAGTLPPGLTALRSLELLDLGGNAELRGAVPRGLLALPRLRAVALRGCRLGGALPEAHDAQEHDTPSLLTWLDLSSNQHTGELPASWAALSALTLVNASFNALEGELPAALAALPALEVLSLSGNRLRGPLPAALLAGTAGGGPPLRLLDVGHNRLTGSVAASVGSHARLAVLDIGFNALTGPPPPPPRGARVWACAGNALSGTLPAAALAAAPGLRHLDYSANKLSGAFPADALLSLPLLRYLNLSGNALTGTLPGDEDARPGALRALGRLETFDVSRNALRGGLPPTLLRAMPAMRRLDVSRNVLTGAMPSDELAALSNLGHFDISYNAGLSGALPAALPASAPLTWFAASHCALAGRVPLALATRPGLTQFDVRGNSLTWEFV